MERVSSIYKPDFSHDQIIPQHFLGGREQHRGHIALGGRGEWKWVTEALSEPNYALMDLHPEI